MNIVEFISNWWKEALEYKERVLKDGGTTKREDIVQQYNQMCKQNGIFDSIKFAWLGEAGYKQRTSGINTFWTKLYSLVVPQAKYGPELVVNGGFDIDSNWSKESTSWTISGGTANNNGTNASLKSIYQPILTSGKKYKVTFTISSISAGYFTVNAGVLSAKFNTIGTYSVTQVASTNNNFFIAASAGAIGSIDNVSVVEVLNSLDGSPTDATQTTSTSQPYLAGNIAPNEKWCLKNPNGGDEYMTHPTISFAANEAWSVTTVITPYGSNAGVNSRILGNDTASKTRIELAPNGGTLYVYGETANVSLAIPNRKGKRTVFHITYNGAGVVSVSINGSTIGTININDSFVFNTLNRASGGQYFFGENSGVVIRVGELTLSQKQAESNKLLSLYPEIPSVTIGSQVWATSNCEMVATPMGNLIANVTANATWADSTNIYNTTYAATSGTVEQKTYAAVKDAAMWCYYNNDPALGAVYGKLLNDYAIKLLDMDIAYYNTANPTTPWGWGIPTEADWNILETTINNDAEALKHAGTTYWTAPNAGTNSSGFTALPAGYRKEDGTFAGLNTTALFGSTDMSVPRIGKSLRLIKR